MRLSKRMRPPIYDQQLYYFVNALVCVMALPAVRLPLLLTRHLVASRKTPCNASLSRALQFMIIFFAALRQLFPLIESPPRAIGTVGNVGEIYPSSLTPTRQPALKLRRGPIYGRDAECRQLINAGAAIHSYCANYRCLYIDSFSACSRRFDCRMVARWVAPSERSATSGWEGVAASGLTESTRL